MGCRCVIVDKDTTKQNANQKIGIYLHWHGDKETVEQILGSAKDLGQRGVISDPSYGWARLCQRFADMITEESLASPFETSKQHAYSTGIGIGIVSDLDTQNWDNGVYYIDDNFDIVKQTDGSELN